MRDPHDPPSRRLDGWGFEGVRFEPTRQLLEWLRGVLGEFGPSVVPVGSGRMETEPPRPLPSFPSATSRDRIDRLSHARGQGLPDILRMRSGRPGRLPDAVVRPSGDDQLAAVLDVCAREGVRVVPWGGGTSVTGGVGVPPGDRPVISLVMDHFTELGPVDTISGLVTAGAGLTGPALEAGLRREGFTLGHFPQSWELSTVGGWIVTRSSGQESLGYGRIEDMVAGCEAVAPGGRLRIPALPASAAGPDLRQLLLGSEGRFGVLTRAVLRVARRPGSVVVDTALLPSWEAGLAAVRDLTRSGLPLTMLRLSDAAETEVALAVGLAGKRGASLLRAFLRARGLSGRGCLLLTGVAGERGSTRRLLRQARSRARSHGAFVLGTRPGGHWLRDRFRHPYLRDALLDVGVATDTLETAAPWSMLESLAETVRRALRQASGDGRVAVLCHVSHPYRDGASLYFTFFYPASADVEETIQRWAILKRAATEAIVGSGGALSHHHGVGSWHAPWLEAEVGETGMEILRTVAERLDPAGILNPHVLLDPTDRLEA